MRATFLLLFAFFVQSCATFNGGSDNEASLLQERAGDRWEALISKDWEKAYSYELPEYRETHDLTKYKRRYGTSVQWKHVDIKAVDIGMDNKTAVVTADLTYQFLTPGTGEMIKTTSQITEKWVKKGSEWWFYPSRGL